jgi:hypothetical protein
MRVAEERRWSVEQSNRQLNGSPGKSVRFVAIDRATVIVAAESIPTMSQYLKTAALEPWVPGDGACLVMPIFDRLPVRNGVAPALTRSHSSRRHAE